MSKSAPQTSSNSGRYTATPHTALIEYITYHLLPHCFSIVLQSLLLPSGSPATLQLASYYTNELLIAILTYTSNSTGLMCFLTHYMLCNYYYANYKAFLIIVV